MVVHLVNFSFCYHANCSIHIMVSLNIRLTIRTPFKCHHYPHLSTIVMIGTIHHHHLFTFIGESFMNSHYFILQVPIQWTSFGIGISPSVSIGCFLHQAILQSTIKVSGVIERSRIFRYGISSVIAMVARQ